MPVREVHMGIVLRRTCSTERSKEMNTTPHLNRSKVKQTALDYASRHRPTNKFSRVSASFLERIEFATHRYIHEEVQRHPSIGRTLK